MPIYEYECTVCGDKKEVVCLNGDIPNHCGSPMKRLISTPAFVKIMGEGGYPSRRKFLRGSAPGGTRNTKPWGSYDPSDKSIGGIGQKIKDVE